jgi:hypothetical protein
VIHLRTCSCCFIWFYLHLSLITGIIRTVLHLVHQTPLLFFVFSRIKLLKACTAGLSIRFPIFLYRSLLPRPPIYLYFPPTYFFNSNSGGCGVQLGPPGTSATNWPIVSAPGVYEDGESGGMMIGRGNRSTRRKPAPVALCPPQIPHDVTGREPGPPRWETSE